MSSTLCRDLQLSWPRPLLFRFEGSWFTTRSRRQRKYGQQLFRCKILGGGHEYASFELTCPFLECGEHIRIVLRHANTLLHTLIQPGKLTRAWSRIVSRTRKCCYGSTCLLPWRTRCSSGQLLQQGDDGRRDRRRVSRTPTITATQIRRFALQTPVGGVPDRRL